MEAQEYLDMMSPAAKTICEKHGLPWQVVTVQGAMESGWGETVSGKLNFFGRKWGGWGTYTECPTWEVEEGVEVEIVARFQDYDTPEQAIEDWCILIEEEPCYAPALNVWKETSDIEEFVYALGPIYATDPEYANKIWCTILANGLLEEE